MELILSSDILGPQLKLRENFYYYFMRGNVPWVCFSEKKFMYIIILCSYLILSTIEIYLIQEQGWGGEIDLKSYPPFQNALFYFLGGEYTVVGVHQENTKVGKKKKPQQRENEFSSGKEEGTSFH